MKLPKMRSLVVLLVLGVGVGVAGIVTVTPAMAQSGYRVCGIAGTSGVFLVKVEKDDILACSYGLARAESYAGIETLRYKMHTCESITNQHFYGLLNGDVCIGANMQTGQLYEVGGATDFLQPV